jgi:hypothetical protein
LDAHLRVMSLVAFLIARCGRCATRQRAFERGMTFRELASEFVRRQADKEVENSRVIKVS